MATTTDWYGSDSTGGNITFTNGTADQLFVYANTATAGTYTDTGTTATSGNTSWADNLMGGTIHLGSIGVGNQTITTDIHLEPEQRLNIRAAQPGEFTVRANLVVPRIQGPEEPPVVQRIDPPAEPTPQIIANARGQDLLKEIVGDVVYRRFQKQGWIDVKSIEKPDITYRIRPWQEIALLERNAKKEWVSNNQSLCIHARQRHVEGDEVAAHVLLCRYNEKTLWKMGNLHGVRRAA